MLLPHLHGVTIDRVDHADDSVVIEARPVAMAAVCPSCGTPSSRVHARYERHLRDSALAGRPVVIRLQVRRFVCGIDGCSQATFAEQIDGLTTPHARFTPPALTALTSIATALAGRAGARLAHVLGTPASRHTLLRLLTSLAIPDVGQVRILGVDDFAIRRGHRYATILVDLEAGRVVDVLPGRDAEPLAQWLRQHPEVEIICRDRAGAYADGARTGAPRATQVADRWHLWHNLAEAVETEVVRHRDALRAPQPEPPKPPEPPELPEAAEPTDTGQPEPRVVARTRERHTIIQQRLADGHSISQIARTLRLDRHTVRRFARTENVDDLLVKICNRPHLLDAHLPYLHQRIATGCTDAAKLYREIREQGYRGSAQTVRAWLQPRRPTHVAAQAPPPAPKIREVARWLLTKPDHLDSASQQQLDQILARNQSLHALAGHVRTFATMMTKLTGHQLPDWIVAVTADDLPALHSFVTGIKRDLAAVTAGLTLPYSSGGVEGRVNRTKTIKRQMYGRASFPLLRRRILLQT